MTHQSALSVLAVGGTVGVPLGAVKDGVKGWMKASKAVAGGLGNEDGSDSRQIVGMTQSADLSEFVGGSELSDVLMVCFTVSKPVIRKTIH